MKLFHKVADRMVSMLVPTATAQAAPCECGSYGTILFQSCGCVAGLKKFRRKWCDGCNVHWDACLTVDYC